MSYATVMRHFTFSAVALFIAVFMVPVSAQSTKPALESRLLHKPLYLLGRWGSDNLLFDAAGHPRQDYKAVSPTLDGIEIESVTLKADHLEIRGQRMALAFPKPGQWRRVRASGKDYSGRIRVNITAPADGDYGPALDLIFTSDLGALTAGLPPAWQFYARRYFGLAAGVPPDTTLEVSTFPKVVEGVTKIGGLVKPPVLILHPDPIYSALARDMRISALCMVYLRVGEDGLPFNIQIVKPAGFGLDEQSVLNVMQYKFKPATRDGKPVKVGIYIDVNFQIF